jgi:hypothetical protein
MGVRHQLPEEGLIMSATVQLRSVLWLATAAVLAVIATLVVSEAWRADAAPGDVDSTFVPTTPCRLFDLRPAPNTVGPRPVPLAAGEVFTQQVTGSNGNCTGALAIPADAVAAAMNVTAANPTAQSNLRVYPGDVAAVPTVSNLNFSAGQAPVPNKVDVKLSPTGTIKLFNQNGTVSVIGDVVGYYTKSSLVELNTRLTALEASTTAQQGVIDALQAGQPFAVHAYDPNSVSLTTTAVSHLNVVVTAPAAGQVTINWSAFTYNLTLGAENACAPYLSTAIPAVIDTGSEGIGYFETAAATNGDQGSFSGTAGFDIAAGATVTYSLACQEYDGDGAVYAPTMTAVFTPAP